MQKEKGRILPIITVVMVIAVLGTIGYFGYQFYSKTKEQQKPIACSQEAKVCPDGSSVGRTGPNCEFAECLVVVDQIANSPAKALATESWKTYKNEVAGYKIKYPEDLILEDKTEAKKNISYISFQTSFPDPVDATKPGHKEENWSVSVSENKDNLSLSEAMNKFTQLTPKIDIKKINVNGIEARRVVFTFEVWDHPGFFNIMTDVFAIKNGKIYDLTCINQVGGSSIKYNCDRFDQMLSTFKFTK